MKAYAEEPTKTICLNENNIIEVMENYRNRGYKFLKAGDTMFKAIKGDEVVLFRPDENCDDSITDFIELLKNVNHGKQ